MPKNKTGTNHNCPGPKVYKTNCQGQSKSTRGKGYCTTHQTWCGLHSIDIVHLKKESCTACDGAKAKAQKEKDAKDKKDKEDRDRAAKEKSKAQSEKDKAPLTKKSLKPK
ncbi:hypothetical protein ONS95_012363 [Cadophora gregata]|uniref:uncharacterized protein n=1 Tax=Cadophora gregata TaxID=51156 RepID=UPI0026DD3F14|nr:uncharacterized protein ONS95_012363 [Cadophora gregata]KAK0118054.1 hypothetical protein ONS95_012363 [Cadophora gregata]KAK0123124.1 hypothetical protein ONS96_010128 [Cadophora gregata f. sp. sojae]